MIDLIYPLGKKIPTLPQPTATSSKRRKAEPEPEYFPIVNDEFIVVGRGERSYCHGGSHVLHPVVHIHILDRNERIYLQKRSMHKDIQPGKWDTAVGGHVIFGESVVEALFREASEELSLHEFNPIYVESYKWESNRETEYVNVFAAVGSFKLKPDHDEVDEGRWWTITEIEEAMGQGVFTENFASEFTRIRSKLLALL